MNEFSTNHLVFFSPTHTSAKIARAIGEGIGMGRRIETDLTLDESDSPIEINDSLQSLLHLYMADVLLRLPYNASSA